MASIAARELRKIGLFFDNTGFTPSPTGSIDRQGSSELLRRDGVNIDVSWSDALIARRYERWHGIRTHEHIAALERDGDAHPGRRLVLFMGAPPCANAVELRATSGSVKFDDALPFGQV